jgi:hypothetical protein
MIALLRSGVLVLAAAGFSSLAACRGDNADDNVGQNTDTTPASEQGAGMRGMSDSMMEQMRAHMRMMDGASADSLKAMLPMHRQMAANMVSQFDREMRDMNMKADARWTATLDSLRRDLVRLPEMSATELRTFMPAHRTRVMRLMEMHRSMMGGMKM